ncbi:MAG: type II toxin-antitoxin system HicB family antitoxin [Desulfuromonadales bacterium]|nr:type II toxin-antitoxin system HicB family antitoxin [Desulfuromonadales bacterium]
MSIKQITPTHPPRPFEAYMHEVAPLSTADGGGFVITFPDLPGCMSDGETIEEAFTNGRDAFSAWIAATIDMGRQVPPPVSRPAELLDVSGKFVARLPKSLHARLAVRAREEGVSLNSLVQTYIAEGLGHRDVA